MAKERYDIDVVFASRNLGIDNLSVNFSPAALALFKIKRDDWH